MSFDRIPADMRAYPQFVLWRAEHRDGSDKPTKVPYSPRSGAHASVADPTTWGSFDDAVAAHDRGGWNGIGFVFTANDPFAGIDLDDTKGDQADYDRQLRIFNEFDSYAEYSPSGQGLHIIVRGSIPQGRRRSKVEVYSSDRFFTMTGNVYRDAPIIDCNDKLQILWAEMGGFADTTDSGFDGPERDPDATIIERMFAAHNGAKARTLFEGRWQGEYPSQSEADFALANIIAFYSDNRVQVLRIFRMSGLGQREKAYRDDYVGPMIARAFDRKAPTIDGFAAFQAKMAAQGAPQPRYSLLTGVDLAALPATEWRIKGVLPARGIVAIYGPSGSGKSFTAIDMAFAIAEGRNWPNGRFRVTKAFVVYLALEGVAGFRNRVLAWQHDHGHMPTDIRFVFDAFRLHDPAYVAELVAACKPFGSDIVIFIDTMNRATAGMNENSPDDMGRIVEGAAALQRETGGLIVIVAHPGKDAEKQLRGHSSLYAALDTVILVDRQGDRRSWKLEKSRDGEDGIDQRFTLETLVIGTDEDGDPITSCVIRPDNAPRERPLSPNQNLGMAAWDEAANSVGRLNEAGEFVGVHIEDWRHAFYAVSTADNPEAKKKAFRTLRDDLVRIGKLKVRDDVYSIAGPTAAATNAAITATIRARGTGG